MKKENNTTYANLGFVTTAPKKTGKGGVRSVIVKTGKDMRGGKK